MIHRCDARRMAQSLSASPSILRLFATLSFSRDSTWASRAVASPQPCRRIQDRSGEILCRRTRWLARVPIRPRSNHSGECGADWWDENPRSQTSTERDFLVWGGSHRHSTANTAKRYCFSTLSLRVHQTIRRDYKRIEANHGLLAQSPATAHPAHPTFFP